MSGKSFSLPPGWKREKKERKSGKYAGQIDTYYIAPDGKRCRSTVEVQRYHESGSLESRGGKSNPKRKGKKAGGKPAVVKKPKVEKPKPKVGPCPDGTAIEVSLLYATLRTMRKRGVFR
jgi:hypothetical protein